ncbi:unnamed protein product [Parnassius mnemosyne]|uniref:Regulatory protein zeste n=1 Tax=Parnassius mnemosyne TaxID=213953 RepID=A0AAV1LL95_9NEOP
MESKKHVFTPMEKKCFLDIIKKYRTVVENKETDGASLRIKNETWSKISAEYNASPHASSQATTKQLRRLWMNLKQRRREALKKEREHRLATGEGSTISDATFDSDIAKVEPAFGMDTDIDSDTVLATTIAQTQQTALAGQRQTDSILEGGDEDRQMRAEKHEMEMKILHYQLREAKAKAELAELILKQKKLCCSDLTS